MTTIQTLYNTLAEQHPRIDSDWWPTRSDNPQFEIAAGCILTQNTQWENAERAVANLHDDNLLKPHTLVETDVKTVQELIRPSGYYNQKARRLHRLAHYLTATEQPAREELLDINGIGKETADSILLYAHDQLYFIIDTYTRRIIDHYNVTDPDQRYDELRREFEHALPDDVDVYKHYHALIVEHGKQL